MAVCSLESDAEIVMGLSRSRRPFDRQPDQPDRLVGIALLGFEHAQMVQGAGMVRLRLEHVAVEVFRLGQSSLPMQRERRLKRLRWDERARSAGRHADLPPLNPALGYRDPRAAIISRDPSKRPEIRCRSSAA